MVSRVFRFFRTDSGTGTGAPGALLSFFPFDDVDLVSFGDLTSFGDFVSAGFSADFSAGFSLDFSLGFAFVVAFSAGAQP